MQPETLLRERLSNDEDTTVPIPNLSRRSVLISPISVMPRSLDPSIAAELDGIAVADLPSLRIAGELNVILPMLAERLTKVEFGPAWLSNWLTEDIEFLARMYQDLTGETHLQVRLEVVDDDACTLFHTDNVRFRLVTTYRGPGTQWILPKARAVHRAADEFPAEAVRQLARGEVAIMRGRQGETPECPGLLHRSPPIKGTGIVRLFLAID